MGNNSDGLTGSPFLADAVMPAPGLDEATTRASAGGFQLNEGDGKEGLVGTPFEKPITGPVGQEETPNSLSGLQKVITITDVKDGPAAGSQIGVEPGVASPTTPVTPIDRK